MRYVMQTTGPYGMKRFLRHPAQKEAMANLKFIECNVRKKQKCPPQWRRRWYDVISYDSCSWKTSEGSTHVPISGRRVSLHGIPVLKPVRRVSAKMSDANVQRVHTRKDTCHHEAVEDDEDDVHPGMQWLMSQYVELK